jgi:hypothetical protein
VLSGVRHSEYKINPLILNRWSPRSMSGGDEELSNEELMPFLKHQDGRHHLSMFNPRGLFTQREIHHLAIVTRRLKAVGLKTNEKEEIDLRGRCLECEKLRDLSSSSTWKCYRCGLIFHEEWVASLHREISNHSYRMVVGSSRS